MSSIQQKTAVVGVGRGGGGGGVNTKHLVSVLPLLVFYFHVLQHQI